MIHHSVPGERSFAILQEAVYQNSNTYGRSTKLPGDWRASVSKNHNNNNNVGVVGNKKMIKPNSSTYTVSAGTGHHIYANASEFDESEQNIPPGHRTQQQHQYQQRQASSPPSPPDHPPPLPPKRTTSLIENQLFIPRLDSISVNPKRISIATSTFWDGHPDLGHFVSGWELGRDGGESTSVWGTTERGGSECVNIWGDPPAVKKGILLLQRDKLLSRWKERYCILTRDYLHCFRRTTSIHRSGVRLSEMGTFMFKLRLADVETIEWESRKSGPIIVIFLPQESRLLIRTPSDTYEALEQWHTLLQECIYMSKERRRALRTGSSTNVSAMTTLKSTISKASEPVLGSEGSSKSSSSSSQSSSERPLAPYPFQSSVRTKGNNPVGRMSLKLTSSNGKMDSVPHNNSSKYSPARDTEEDYEEVLEEEEDEDDRFLSQIHFPVNKRCTRASIAVVERSSAGPSMTLHDFVKNPWKSNGCVPTRRVPPQQYTGDYSMPRDAIGNSRLRPESWHPQWTREHHNPSGSTSSINSRSHHQHGLPNPNQLGGPWGKNNSMMSANFSRGKDSLYSTSRHTSEITFRKLS